MSGVQKALMHCFVLLSLIVSISFVQVQAFEECAADSSSAGKWKNETGHGDCTDCGAGMFSVINGSSSVTAGLGGLPGKYLGTEGNDAESDCMACAAGKYSVINGSSSKTPCPDCPPGMYQYSYLETIGNDALSHCMACAAANSNWPSRSTAQTACSCKAGYGGDTGTRDFTALPRIAEFESDKTGPRVGGDFVRLTVEVGGEKQYFNGVFDLNDVKSPKNIFSKGGNTRGLVLITPKFVGVPGDISTQIQPEVDPLKMVYFFYTVEDVQTAVESANPSRGIIGIRILLRISYFSYPKEVLFVKFNDVYLLPDDNVEILRASSLDMTLIKIQWTNLSQPSGHRVPVTPKMCPEPCNESEQFAFEEVHVSLPQLVSHVPMSGYFQKGSIGPVYLILQNAAKSTISRIFAYFQNRTLSASVNMTTKMDTQPVAGNVRLNIPMAPTFMRAAQGPFNVMVGFEFTARVVKIQPQPVPTSTIISGRKIQVKNTVTFTGSNFPQDLEKDETVAMLDKKNVTVLRVEHQGSCLPLEYDCNRTRVVLQLPEVFSPSAVKLVLSNRGQNLHPLALDMDIAFQPSCPDYDRFCQEKELIANFEAFLTVECSAVYCISKDSIRTPKVLNFSPKEGSRAGGTNVKVQRNDLPGFPESDVTVTVLGTAYVETAQVLTLQQSAASTLQTGSAFLTFITPSFTSDDDFATITISVLVGGSLRSASFPFEYTPEIIGAAQVLEFFPKNVFVTEDLQLLFTVGNVQRLKPSFSSAEIKAQAQGLDVAATQIVVLSSSRNFTVVRMSLPYNRTQGRYTGFLKISAGRIVDQLGTLNLSNMYPTAKAPYMFAVRVSKTMKAGQVFQMPVTLTEQFIPDVSALEAASGEIQPTGVARINPDEQFVVHGRCQHNEPVQIVWKITPPIPLEYYETLADDVSGSVACAAILFGAAVYLTTMNYKTSSEYLAAKAKVMEGAQTKSEEREDAAGVVGMKSIDKSHSGRVSEGGAGVQGVRTDTPAKTGMIST